MKARTVFYQALIVMHCRIPYAFIGNSITIRILNQIKMTQSSCFECTVDSSIESTITGKEK